VKAALFLRALYVARRNKAGDRFSLVTDFVFLAAILFADSERTQLINMNKPIEPDAFDPNFILPMFRNR